MDFKALKHFLHLAESLHFGRSSDALHMSPSTLSRSISRLEQEVGVALFERDNRSVRLTPSGRNFREFAEKTLSEWQAVRQNLNSQTGEITGRIKIYSSVTASYSLMSPILAEFRQQYPAVEVSLKTGDAAFAVDQVLSREVDLAIAPRPDQMPSQLAFFSIKKTPLVFIAPVVDCPVQQLLSSENLKWQDIPFVMPEYGLSRKRIDAWFRKQNIRPRIQAEVEGHEAIVSMVSLGMGVGVVPQLVIDSSPMAGGIRQLHPVPELPPYNVGVVAHERRLSEELIHLFWDLVASAKHTTG